MSLNAVISSLPKELRPVLKNISAKPVVLTTTTSNNLAQDNSLQFCGPVAGRIEYVFNFHYHAGGSDICWRLIGGNLPTAGTSSSEPALQVQSVGEFFERPQMDPKLLPKSKPLPPIKLPGAHQVHLHSPEKDAMPVLATIDPSIDGNWIAAKIVSRLKLKHQVASIHKSVPVIDGQTFAKTRVFVELSCGNLETGNQCKHRFFVVNHCDAFDLLFGTMEC